MAEQGTKTAKEQSAASSGKSVSFSVTMTQDKVTKNAVRYAEDHANETEPDRIGQLYLQKHNFPNGAPQRITVNVSTLAS